MKREIFWADVVGKTVRVGNVAIECAPSEAHALAKELNDVVRRFFREKRPIQKVEEKIGRMTPAEKRMVLLLRYAVMYVLDHE